VAEDSKRRRCQTDHRRDFRYYRPIALLTGGVPCQPTSHVGLMRGTADPRWMWPAAMRACASFDQKSRSMRTRQLCLFSKVDEPSTELCLKWSRSGIESVVGRISRCRVWWQGICDIDSSSLLPTPTAAEIGGNLTQPKPTDRREQGEQLGQTVGKTLPTATANDGRKRGNNAYWKDSRRQTTSTTIYLEHCSGNFSRRLSRHAGAPRWSISTSGRRGTPWIRRRRL